MHDSIVDSYTLMDEPFMRQFFDGRPDLAAIVLRAILGKPELELATATTRRMAVCPDNRVEQFGVYCTDVEGGVYDIEFVRMADDPVGRGVLMSTLLMLERMHEAEDLGPFRSDSLPEANVVVVTDGDATGHGAAVARYTWTGGDTDTPLDKKVWLLFVNAAFNFEEGEVKTQRRPGKPRG